MSVRIITGDALEQLRLLPDESMHCCVTSPPYYGLRDYGVAGQIGLEPTPDAYVAALVAVFREVRRVLRSDATLWLNIGDSYAGASTIGWRAGNPEKNKGNSNRDGVGAVAGCKPKDLIGIPWMLAFALRADGWWLRQDIIWSKPNPMPESVTDRCTKAHEYLFLLSKSERYYYDAAAIAEASVPDDPRRPYGSPGANAMDPRGEQGAGRIRAPANRKRGEFNGKTNDMPGREAFRAFTEFRNRRSVWTITTEAFPEAHFATFPPALIEPCILAGCPEGGTVLDCFGGAGTTGLVADRLSRNAILIELNPEYSEMARRRIHGDAPLFADVKRDKPGCNQAGAK